MTMSPFSILNEGNAPKSFYDILMLVKKYDKPILITENGMEMSVPSHAKNGAKADDSGMAAYIVRHLFWLHQAMSKGVKVQGYFYWSLIDNYEWNHGFDLRFGLFGFDPKILTKSGSHGAALPSSKRSTKAMNSPAVSSNTTSPKKKKNSCPKPDDS